MKELNETVEHIVVFYLKQRKLTTCCFVINCKRLEVLETEQT